MGRRRVRPLWPISVTLTAACEITALRRSRIVAAIKNGMPAYLDGARTIVMVEDLAKLIRSLPRRR